MVQGLYGAFYDKNNPKRFDKWRDLVLLKRMDASESRELVTAGDSVQSVPLVGSTLAPALEPT